MYGNQCLLPAPRRRTQQQPDVKWNEELNLLDHAAGEPAVGDRPRCCPRADGCAVTGVTCGGRSSAGPSSRCRHFWKPARAEAANRRDGRGRIVSRVRSARHELRTPQAVTLKKVDVMSASGDHRVLLSLSDSALVRAVTRPGRRANGWPGAASKSRAGHGPSCSCGFPVEPAERRPGDPASPNDRTGTGDSAKTQQLDAASRAGDGRGSGHRAAARGGVWLTGNGPAAESGHRRRR